MTENKKFNGILSLTIENIKKIKAISIHPTGGFVEITGRNGQGKSTVLDRWLPGLDALPWRGFFGTRIFSTHANPNFFADFVVFSSFIVLAEFLRPSKHHHSISVIVFLILSFYNFLVVK